MRPAGDLGSRAGWDRRSFQKRTSERGTYVSADGVARVPDLELVGNGRLDVQRKPLLRPDVARSEVLDDTPEIVGDGLLHSPLRHPDHGLLPPGVARRKEELTLLESVRIIDGEVHRRATGDVCTRAGHPEGEDAVIAHRLRERSGVLRRAVQRVRDVPRDGLMERLCWLHESLRHAERTLLVHSEENVLPLLAVRSSHERHDIERRQEPAPELTLCLEHVETARHEHADNPRPPRVLAMDVEHIHLAPGDDQAVTVTTAPNHLACLAGIRPLLEQRGPVHQAYDTLVVAPPLSDRDLLRENLTTALGLHFEDRTDGRVGPSALYFGQVFEPHWF